VVAAQENKDVLFQVVSKLVSFGIKDVVCCPGGRAAPLVEALAFCKHFNFYSFFEERSAGFFALGKIKQTGRPVAVVTTSGTAAAELLPSCIESYYSSAPLCLITTDRPIRFRGSGAPQSIEQEHLFNPYVSCSIDLPQKSLEAFRWDRQAPCHMNLCLEEQYEFVQEKLQIMETEESYIKKTHKLPEELLARLSSHSYPLLFIGELPKSLLVLTAKLLKKWKIPAFVDPTSGLLCDKELEHFLLLDKKGFISYASHLSYPVDAIVRIGSVPLPRAWRDLENMLNLPVYSFSQNPFSGLSGRQKPFPLDETVLQDLHTVYFPENSSYKLLQENEKKRQKLELSLSKYPFSEQAFVSSLASALTKNDTLYLGNSLPIRHFALCSFIGTKNIFANRGANGIDGQLSTFLGTASKKGKNIGVFGDLTTLYDLAAPWALQYVPKNCLFIVINNGGGQIFRGMFENPIHKNTHSLEFSCFASMWKMDYQKVFFWDDALLEIEKPSLVEFVPKQEKTERIGEILLE